jgi:hypothetical protein
VAPQDLVRAIALDAGSSLVPGGDASLGIEVENGVVTNGIDQEPKPLVRWEFRDRGGSDLERNIGALIRGSRRDLR